MNPCPEFESLLIDRAAGELSDADRLVVERHLSECRSCAAEAEALERTLSALALPPRSAEERAALSSLPQRTGMAWRRGERRRSMLKGAVAGFMASAAAAALILVPVARREANANANRADPTVTALERWASPSPFGGAFRELSLDSFGSAPEDEGGQ
jgi:anti-sigma factor RsiW